MAPFAALLALVSLAAPAATDVRPDPCRAARTSFPLRVQGVADDTLAALASYRESWRAACDATSPVDLDSLLGDAESLSSDVILSRVLDVVTRVLPKGATWPLPGVRRRGRSEIVPDWAAFAAMADRGTADDQRFWHAAALAADADGDPVWLGPVPAHWKDPCVRVGEVQWADIAAAVAQMERTRTERYAAHGERLRERLVETLEAMGRGTVCGCVRGDAAAGLEPLAQAHEHERFGTAARRAITKAAVGALERMRKGRVRWLRESPDAAPTGCDAKP